MQDLDVKESIQKIQKIKPKIKKQLEELVVNGRRNENADMEDKVNRCTTNEEAEKVIQEFKEIIKNKKIDIMQLPYYQGQIFQNLRRRNLLSAWF